MKRELKILDKPKNIKKLLFIFYLLLIVLLILDFFVHKHAEFPWEARINFFAAYGFVCYVALIYIAKLLRLFIMRKEDYYEKK